MKLSETSKIIIGVSMIVCLFLWAFIWMFSEINRIHWRVWHEGFETKQCRPYEVIYETIEERKDRLDKLYPTNEPDPRICFNKENEAVTCPDCPDCPVCKEPMSASVKCSACASLGWCDDVCRTRFCPQQGNYFRESLIETHILLENCQTLLKIKYE